jgi:simple sugar transport system permease protein
VIVAALALFLEATVRAATPLALAALGETVAERAGIINLGVEGALISGAFGALVGANAFGVAGGIVVAIAAGATIGAVFALFVIGLRTDQIITGTAMSLLALGLTGTLYRAEFGTGGAALTTPTLHALPIWGLSSLPIVGRAFFAQPLTTYFVYAATAGTWWWLFRTHGGLSLRACGEQPRAARAAGIRIDRVQALAVIYAGGLAGIAGGVLVISQAGTFVEGMSAGRGFVSIAIVVLGRWHPAGVVFAALLFGAASALQTLFQSLGTNLPYQIFLALPYVLTLLALAGFAGRSRAPAALGQPTSE